MQSTINRLGRLYGPAWRRRTLRAWALRMAPVAQQAAAAAIAWWLARRIGSHPDPFFAPLAAFIALNAPVGERGRNAMRMLIGVVIGIIVGELALALLSNAWFSVAFACFVGAGIATALGGARLVIGQAAGGAILTVASAQGEVGIYRLQDALIGGGVALIFSQFLFTPEPVRFLRRSQMSLLSSLAEALEHMVDAAFDDADWKRQRATHGLRRVRDSLATFSTLRQTGAWMTRGTLFGRVRRADALVEYERLEHLDACVEGSLMLARLVDVDSAARRRNIPLISELVAVFRRLAKGLDDVDVRHEVATRIAVLYRDAATEGAAAPPDEAIHLTLRIVATDLLAYLGVEQARIEEALSDPDILDRVPSPPGSGFQAAALWPVQRT